MMVLVWPVAFEKIGQTVTADRDGQGRPHLGVDLFCAANTPVFAAHEGAVIRVVDGRGSADPNRRRAGLWVDVGFGRVVFRYLHLGQAIVEPGEQVFSKSLLGFVAPGGRAHLHFEIRKRTESGYGAALDPLLLLPKRGDTDV